MTTPALPPTVATGARCAVHPGRRAADHCPVCDRLRCAADSAAHGDSGCLACLAVAPARVPVPRPERWLRAALAAFAVALVGGWIAAEYVDTQYFATVAPGLVGLACAWAAWAAARDANPRLAAAVGVPAGLLATGLSDRLVPGGQNLFLPLGHRIPPYIAAVAGVLAWRLLFGPPRQR